MSLVLIRGLPGSGKSELASIVSSTGMRHFETDMFFLRPDGTYRFHPEELSDAHAWCQREVRINLLLDRNVVVSNTFSRNWEMKPYADMARELGHRLYIVQSQGKFENIHNVPPEVLAKMGARWEAVDPQLFNNHTK